jgi:hypothetical protein
MPTFITDFLKGLQRINQIFIFVESLEKHNYLLSYHSKAGVVAQFY